MAFIKADQEYRLSQKYGAIWYNPEDGQVYGIPETWASTDRPFYLLTNGEETEVRSFAFSSADYLSGESRVLAATWLSGLVGLVIETFAAGPDFGSLDRRIYWFDDDDGSYQAQHKQIDGFKALGARLEVVEDEFVQTTFIQEPAMGTIVRWNFGDFPPGEDHTPMEKYQYMFHRELYGEARGMDFDDFQTLFFGSPRRYLVVANSSGLVVWIDCESWDSLYIHPVIYKLFGCIEARNITDVALDRNYDTQGLSGKRLFVLDSNTRLLVYNLEPYGIEETGYENTPRVMQLTAEAKSVQVDDEIEISGMFYDMWDQYLERSGISAELISGSNRGQFYDPDAETWGVRVRGETDSSGVFTATYKGLLAGPDDIVGRCLDE